MQDVASLSHPNIAALYDWGIARVADTSTAYVVNEQLTGGSLRDMFDRGRRLSPSQALAVGSRPVAASITPIGEGSSTAN